MIVIEVWYGDILDEKDIVRALIVYDNFFSQFIINQKISDVLNIAFGDKYILNFGITNGIDSFITENFMILSFNY